MRVSGTSSMAISLADIWGGIPRCSSATSKAWKENSSQKFSRFSLQQDFPGQRYENDHIHSYILPAEGLSDDFLETKRSNHWKKRLQIGCPCNE